ncbi:MAG: hypothetical protein DA407_11575 [Bacteroidetes bacterium]|nr:MAG: hypothetical protein DA407_11575 [Bacteroidota bacterium]
MLTFKQNNIPDLAFKKAFKKPIAINCIQINEPFSVETMEGKMKGKKGDWLMVGVNGEMYPCDQDIFKKTYDVLN